MIRRLGAGTLVALVALALLVPDPGTTFPAGAAPAGAIVLSGQPAWNRLGDTVNLRVGIRGAAPELEVRASIHRAVTSRIAFERTLGGEDLGSQLATQRAPVGLLPLVGSDRIISLQLQDPAAPRDPNRIRLVVNGAAGVFPVAIELIDPESTDVVDSFVTHLVVTSGDDLSEQLSPLRVAWLWHVAAGPSLLPDGTVSPAFVDSLDRGGRLGRLATGLDQVQGLPITVVPTPETIGALRAASAQSTRASTILDRIAGAAAAPDATVLAGSYTTVDGPGLEAAGLGEAYATALADGRATLESILDSAIDRTVAPPQALDAGTLTRLRAEAGTSRVVVRASDLAGAEPADQFTAARPFQLDTPVGPFQAVEVNDLASTLLVQSGADALRAQQLLAGLSVVALEQPNRTRGVVVTSPLLWTVRTERTEALAVGLIDHPLLALANIGEIFGAVPPATVRERAYTRKLAPVPLRAAPLTLSQYRAATRDVDAFASMVPAEDPEAAALREQVRLSLASGTPDAGRRVAQDRIARVNAAIAAVTSSVAAPTSRTITLTSRQASVPVSVENTADRALTVRVTLSSAKLTFPRGPDRVVRIRPGKNRTIRFTVEARTSGTFPVLIDVDSPDKHLALQRVRYTVRSSVSNVGILLTVGAALFLALWWITHWRRSRRTPRTSHAPPPAPGAPNAPSPATP